MKIKCKEKKVLDLINMHDRSVFVKIWLNSSVTFSNVYMYSEKGKYTHGVTVTVTNSIHNDIKVVESINSNFHGYRFKGI